MWHDVIVDKGSEREGQATSGSALSIRLTAPTKKGFDVSSHAWAYWVCHLFLDMGMTVYKDTDTGRALAELLAEKKSGDEIRAFLLPVFLTHVAPDKLERRVECAIAGAWSSGRREKSAEIRATLWAD